MLCGVARASLEYALEYTSQRTAFGQVIAQFQGISFAAADMHMENDGATLGVLKAAWALDSDLEEAEKLSSQALVAASRAALFSSNWAVQMLGGHGYTFDYPVENGCGMQGRWPRMPVKKKPLCTLPTQLFKEDHGMALEFLESPQQQTIREFVHWVAKEKMRPNALEADRNQEVPIGLLTELKEMGITMDTGSGGGRLEEGSEKKRRRPQRSLTGLS